MHRNEPSYAPLHRKTNQTSEANASTPTGAAAPAGTTPTRHATPHLVVALDVIISVFNEPCDPQHRAEDLEKNKKN